MSERAHPQDRGFKNPLFGIIKNPYRQRLQQRYKSCNGYIRNLDVCDIPCGTGWGSSLLIGYKSLVGIDISPEAVTYAQSHYSTKSARFITGDMSSIPLPEDSVDMVLCLEGFEHVTREIGLQFICEAKRVLRRNALLIMTSPVLNEHGLPTKNPYHLCEYPEEELISLLNYHFQIQEIERIKGPDSPIYRFLLKNFKNFRYLNQ